MEQARLESAAVRARGHARRFHLAVMHPPNWMQVLRYCVVGASGYAVNLVAFLLLDHSLHYMVAFVLAFGLAATSNFAWNRVWTFQVKHGVPHHQYARFLTVSAMALCLDLAVLRALVEGRGWRRSRRPR